MGGLDDGVIITFENDTVKMTNILGTLVGITFLLVKRNLKKKHDSFAYLLQIPPPVLLRILTNI